MEEKSYVEKYELEEEGIKVDENSGANCCI